MNHLIEPGMLPETGVHLIGGAPFAGKSTLEAQIIKSHVTGESFLDGLTFKQLSPDQVGVIFTDRPMSDNELWLNKLSLHDVQRYAIADDPSMAQKMRALSKDPCYGYELFRECFDSLREPDRLKSVFLDVGTNLFFGSSVHDTAGVHRHMVLLQQFSKQHGCAINSLCYGTKQKNAKGEQYARPVDRIMGGPTLRGCASTMLFLTAVGEDTESAKTGHQALHWFTRHGESKLYNVKKDAQGLFIQVSGVISAGSTTKRDWDVCAYIDHPMTRAELVERAISDGHSSSAAYAAITASVKGGLLTELPDGRFCLDSVGPES